MLGRCEDDTDPAGQPAEELETVLKALWKDMSWHLGARAETNRFLMRVCAGVGTLIATPMPASSARALSSLR